MPKQMLRSQDAAAPVDAPPKEPSATGAGSHSRPAIVRAAAAAAPLAPVAVVVVTWNSSREIVGCLSAILAENPAEVVVVDNASTDCTRALVAALSPHVRLIGMATNTGFAAGCNVGYACTQAPYVLFLNDDAQVRPGYLATLLTALKTRSDAASAIGKLVHAAPEGTTIDSAGIVLHAHALRPLDRGHGDPDVGQFDQPEEIFGPSGAAALFRRAALAALKEPPFDVRLFAYYEDVDLAWRLNRRGWRHLYEPLAVAHHGRRGPSNKPAAIKTRAFVNRYTVWRKNESWRGFLRYAPVAVAWELARLARIGWRDPTALRRILTQAAPALRRHKA